MKTANLAIVFTDIKGFTERTSRQTLEANQRLLQTHSELLTPLFQGFGGTIVKSIGDAFMVTFESPTQAVLCGIAIQDRLWFHNRALGPDDRLDVRIAINVGEVRVENRDVFGEPVNIAARVEGIAEVGEVYFTEAVYLSMNKADVPSEPVGDFELKGIPGKVKVYRVPHAPYRVEAPAPSATVADAQPAVPRPSANGSPSAAAELPPFGNLGLSRYKGDNAAAQFGAVVNTLAERTSRAVAETSRAVTAMSRSSRPVWLTPKLILPAAVGIVVVAALVVGLSGGGVKSAIRAVAGATPEERRARVAEAEALIAQEKDPVDRLWWEGQLREAEGAWGQAAQRYVSAARRGSSKAESHLLDLLEHDECAARSEAADAVARLRLKKARSALEDLAEDGGPGEGSGGVLGTALGRCDSRAAARQALKQLE